MAHPPPPPPPPPEPSSLYRAGPPGISPQVAELEAAPLRGGILTPDGSLAFEMSAEEPAKAAVSPEPTSNLVHRPRQSAPPAESVQAHPWPFYLDNDQPAANKTAARHPARPASVPGAGPLSAKNQGDDGDGSERDPCTAAGPPSKTDDNDAHDQDDDDDDKGKDNNSNSSTTKNNHAQLQPTPDGTPQRQQQRDSLPANPWPYHGPPVSADGGPSATVYPSARAHDKVKLADDVASAITRPAPVQVSDGAAADIAPPVSGKIALTPDSATSSTLALRPLSQSSSQLPPVSSSSTASSAAGWAASSAHHPWPPHGTAGGPADAGGPSPSVSQTSAMSAPTSPRPLSSAPWVRPPPTPYPHPPISRLSDPHADAASSASITPVTTPPAPFPGSYTPLGMSYHYPQPTYVSTAPASLSSSPYPSPFHQPVPRPPNVRLPQDVVSEPTTSPSDSPPASHQPSRPGSQPGPSSPFPTAPPSTATTTTATLASYPPPQPMYVSRPSVACPSPAPSFPNPGFVGGPPPVAVGYGWGPGALVPMPMHPMQPMHPMPMPMPSTQAPPPRPPRTSSGSLFSSASAKRWLDKTSQKLESKLEEVLQGPPPPQDPAYRPSYGPPPASHYGAVAQGYGAYPSGAPWAGSGPPGPWRGPGS